MTKKIDYRLLIQHPTQIDFDFTKVDDFEVLWNFVLWLETGPKPVIVKFRFINYGVLSSVLQWMRYCRLEYLEIDIPPVADLGLMKKELGPGIKYLSKHPIRFIKFGCLLDYYLCLFDKVSIFC